MSFISSLLKIIFITASVFPLYSETFIASLRRVRKEGNAINSYCLLALLSDNAHGCGIQAEIWTGFPSVNNAYNREAVFHRLCELCQDK